MVAMAKNVLGANDKTTTPRPCLGVARLKKSKWPDEARTFAQDVRKSKISLFLQIVVV